jgi:uncharacterized protein (TIGR02996 family)
MPTPIPDEQAALLAAIVAHPDDDTPRLVYADWLQENGDEEQAQFIRDSIQIEWLEDYEDDRRERMAKRLDGAAVRNGERWVEQLGVRPHDLVYDRGMVEGVIYEGVEFFLADAPLLFARVPVRSVVLDEIGGYDLMSDPLSKLAGMRELARLRDLRLSNRGYPVFSEGWERFITSPYLVNLQELAVESVALTDEDALAFDRCNSLHRIEELSLVGNQLTAVGALTVVRSPHLSNLTRLKLWHNAIVQDRTPGSTYLALRDALIERFDGVEAI